MIRYTQTVRNKFLTVDASCLDDFIAAYEHAAKQMREWKAAGIQLEPGTAEDDYATFFTDDPVAAARLGFEQEMEQGEDEQDE